MSYSLLTSDFLTDTKKSQDKIVGLETEFMVERCVLCF